MLYDIDKVIFKYIFSINIKVEVKSNSFFLKIFILCLGFFKLILKTIILIQPLENSIPIMALFLVAQRLFRMACLQQKLGQRICNLRVDSLSLSSGVKSFRINSGEYCIQNSDGNRTVQSQEVPGRSRDRTGQDRT